MKELLEVIAKRLVEHPEQVVVTETNNERALVLELKEVCVSNVCLSEDFPL